MFPLLLHRVPHPSASDSVPPSDVNDVQPPVADESALLKEAAFFHRQMFGCAATLQLAKYYATAHAEFSGLGETSLDEHRTVQTVVERQLDAPSIEPWLRSRPIRHLLSRKLLLIAYLAECDGSHPEIHWQTVGTVRSFGRLIASGFRGVFRLLRGRVQKAIHGLV